MDIHCSINGKKRDVMRAVRKTGNLLPPGEKVSAGRVALPLAMEGGFLQEIFQMMARRLALQTFLKAERYVTEHQAQPRPLFFS